jgi:hypothetical protein
MFRLASALSVAVAVVAQPPPVPPPALSCYVSLPAPPGLNPGDTWWDFTGVASLSGFVVTDTRGNADSVYDYYIRVCNNMGK